MCAMPGFKATNHDSHVKVYRQQMSVLNLHDFHVKQWKANAAAQCRWKTKHDVGFRLNARLRVQIRKALKGKKAGRSWESFVGYSLDELCSHFSRMLPKKMTLDDALAAGWHIDHIVPKSTFNLADESELRAAWCMSNLRLIPAKENIRKSAKRVSLL